MELSLLQTKVHLWGMLDNMFKCINESKLKVKTINNIVNILLEKSRLININTYQDTNDKK